MLCLRFGRAALLVTALACSTIGCQLAPFPAATPSQSATDTESEVSSLFRDLGLSADQELAIIRIRAEMRDKAEPLRDSTEAYALAIGRAATLCKGNHMGLRSAASWAAYTAEQLRDPLLDGIDEVHGLLTPAQRRTVAKRMLKREEDSDSEEGTEDGAESLGDTIDLSIGQMITVLARANALRERVEQKIEPLRGQLKDAVVAFAEDDFHIREHRIAKAPFPTLVTRFVNSAVRTLLPILDREQCTVLGDYIERSVAEQNP